MANYLPVLLVSVSTNAGTTNIPDDSELSTQPTAQVDYLSHDWQEEDVWRSWRNMTRQKKAIVNGPRLENASWRTWWKQRNKLGTVSPETLNWLKDSDVTWLYGPLHTAGGDWNPTPRDDSASNSRTPTSAVPARSNSPSTSNALRPAFYKPILKHRSISQLLTSDFPPTSPIFSPVDSEEEENDPDDGHDHASTSTSTTATSTTRPQRPPLFHTKSDTHITRWGPNRAFRKDSPPRVDPPGIDRQLETTQSGSSNHGSTTSSGLASSGSSSQQISAGGAIRSSLSQDSNSSGSAGASSNERSHAGGHKKKHISFNTFVEQCIAIEKPKKNASGYFCAIPEGAWPGTRMSCVEDEGYEEDHEDSDDELSIDVPGARWEADDATSSTGGALGIRSDSDNDDDEEDEEDDVIEIRSTSSRTPTLEPKKKPSPRSQSKVSTTSSSSSASTYTSTTDNTTPSPSGSISPSRRTSSSSNLPRKSSSSSLYRRSSHNALPQYSSNYRPSFSRVPRPPGLVRRTSNDASSRSHSASQHVTIAPIAPTLLKTTPTSSWTDIGGAGDDGLSLISGGSGNGGEDQYAGWAWGIGGKVNIEPSDETILSDEASSTCATLPRRRSWASSSDSNGTAGGIGFGMPNGVNPAALYAAQQNGFAPGAFGTGRGGMDDDAQGSDGTPVELVYVPPFEYQYAEEVFEDEDEEEKEPKGQTDQYPKVNGSVGPAAASPIPINGAAVPKVVVDASSTVTTSRSLKSSSPSKRSTRRPTLVEEEDDREEDAYDYFGGPDLGDDYYYYARRGGRGYDYGVSSSSGTGAGVGVGRVRNTPTQRSSPATNGSSVSYAANARQLERQRERKRVGSGGERQSRSRSRSESRTPSPAMMSSTSPTDTNATSVGLSRNGSSSSIGNGSDGRKRSQNGSSPTKNDMLSPGRASPATLPHSSSQDLLCPPSRGRTLDSPSSSYVRPGGVGPAQDERRGRSSTRTSSSSSSWTERSTSGSVGTGSSTSPMGSLSPDGSGARSSGVGLGIGAVLANGNGRVVEKDVGGRGRERRGRERTSCKTLSAASSPAVSPPASNSVGLPPSPPKPRTVTDMSGSMISHTSTSSSSSSTAVPPSTVGPSYSDDGADEDNTVTPSADSPETIFMRHAEEALRQKVQTPSNSPIVEMSLSSWARKDASNDTLTASSGSRTPTPTVSSASERPMSDPRDQEPSNSAKADSTHIPPNSNTPATSSICQHRVPLASPSRRRPPSTLMPSPPAPSKPKTTDFTAAVSPSSPGLNGVPSPGATPTVPGSQAVSHHDTTIVEKAVDIVSSAGAFFGLWGHHGHPSERPSSAERT